MRQECSVFAREWRIKLYQKRSTSTIECRNLCTHVKRVLFRVAIAEGKYMSCLRGNNLFGITAQIECVLFGAEHTKPIVVGISERERVLDGVAEREHAAVLFARSSCTAEGTRVTELPFGVAERKRVFWGIVQREHICRREGTCLVWGCRYRGNVSSCGVAEMAHIGLSGVAKLRERVF